MLPTFRADPRVEIVAAADPRREATARLAAELGAREHDSVASLAADPVVEAIYVATPHQLHAAHVGLAAANGKHVLVEKPIALTLAECDAMIRAVDRAGVSLVVGHSHSFDRPYLRAREIVASGAVGAVRMIHAQYYTDFLYRPRRPEELRTEDGGGALFSQAAHQVDVVRLLAGARAVTVRAFTGAWDRARPTEGAYAALIGFEHGVFASLTYSGYGHFDGDELCGGIGEMGHPVDPKRHGAMRRMLRSAVGAAEEAALKNARNYGGGAYAERAGGDGPWHQHFGTVIVSCERADLRPLPHGVMIHDDDEVRLDALEKPAVPRVEVIDELYGAIVEGRAPLHDGRWAKATLEVCLAMLASSREGREVALTRAPDPS